MKSRILLPRECQEWNFSSRDALCTPKNAKNATFHQKSHFGFLMCMYAENATFTLSVRIWQNPEMRFFIESRISHPWKYRKCDFWNSNGGAACHWRGFACHYTILWALGLSYHRCVRERRREGGRKGERGDGRKLRSLKIMAKTNDADTQPCVKLFLQFLVSNYVPLQNLNFRVLHFHNFVDNIDAFTREMMKIY